MPKANAIDLAKTLRKLKTGNFEFFHILTFAACYHPVRKKKFRNVLCGSWRSLRETHPKVKHCFDYF